MDKKQTQHWYEAVPHHDFGANESVYIWHKSSNGRVNRPIAELSRCDANTLEFTNLVKRVIDKLNA